jgi:CRISPR-associated protein Csm4
MKTLRMQVRPRSAFGGALRGDTLFGQLCWAVRHRFGEEPLDALLEGYNVGRPFAVCSDAFPSGYLPRPALPLHRFRRVDEDRKRVKKRQWLPLEAAGEPVARWLEHCVGDAELNDSEGKPTSQRHPQPHNSIHRGLGTTLGAEFAPYAQEQLWFRPGLRLDLWLLFDPARIEREHLEHCIADIGLAGYGRDASIGLGKFEVASSEESALPHQEGADTCYTLAPCAPQGQKLDPSRSFYAPFTRFGRHGDRAVLGGRPFKNPVLLADTGALLVPPTLPDTPLVGQGLGGDGELSKEIEATVHQGFAPSIFVRLGGEMK